ncbi:MAG: ArsR family transcriptional regulator [Spirochaetaceae bacterium]|nr:MAG: ArsR family transcriptional regulator [Spirochaetaceae bacterium]
MDTVEYLKALADETRLRIVSLLTQADTLCACEVETVLGVNQSNLSRHLTRLKHAGVVHAVKSGQWVHYSLARESAMHADLVSRAVEIARAELPQLQTDASRLEDYKASRFTCDTIKQWVAR